MDAPWHARAVLAACWGGIAVGTTAAAYQFFTNLHTVPITERIQVVAFTKEDENVCE